MKRIRGLLKLLEDIEPWFTKRVCDKNGNVYNFMGALNFPTRDYHFLLVDVKNGSKTHIPLYPGIVNDYRLEDDLDTKEKWDIERTCKEARAISKNIKNKSKKEKKKRKM